MANLGNLPATGSAGGNDRLVVRKNGQITDNRVDVGNLSINSSQILNTQFLEQSNNLSDVSDSGISRANLAADIGDTGLLEGGLLTDGGGLTLNVAAGSGVIFDRTSSQENPLVTRVTWPAQSLALPADPGGTRNIIVDGTGTLILEPIFEIDRSELFLGAVEINPAGDGIELILNGTISSFRRSEISSALGPINVAGNVFSGVPGTLNIQKGSGAFYSDSISYKTSPNSPNNTNNASLNTSTGDTFRYTWRDNAGGYVFSFGNTLLIPGAFDDGTTPPGFYAPGTPPNGVIPVNQWGYQIVFQEIETNQIAIQFGDTFYSSLLLAQNSPKLVPLNPLADSSVIVARAIIYHRGGGTDLTNPADAFFEDLGKFGSISTTGVGVASSGESNTASNLGAGEGLFAQKNVFDLQFKSLVGGTNITASSDANTVTLTGDAAVFQDSIQANSASGVFIKNSGGTNVIGVGGLSASGGLSVFADFQVSGTSSLDAVDQVMGFTKAETGTSYNLTPGDSGKIITLDNSGAITLNVPVGLGAGFNCTIIQKGAGVVTVTAVGTTIVNRQAHTQTAGQGAVIGLYSDVANNFYLTGDTQ